VIVIVVSWVPMVLFAIRGWGKPPARLRGAGVKAIGRADTAHPMDSLMDGLREYPPNEVVMLPDRETNWESAARMAERIRDEVGLPVTTIEASSPGDLSQKDAEKRSPR